MASPRPAEPVDIFVSYAREDRACAARLADALAACGWRVWWDREIDVGADFAALIESNLEGAQAVIVLWSAQSVRSAFVKDEAGRAREASKLQPVRIEDVELPLGFGQIQTFDLIDCDTSGPEFDSLVDQLGRALAKGAPAPVAPRRPRRLSRLLRRPAVWVGVAAVAALAIIAVLGRGYSREKRCTEAFVHTDTGVQRLQDGSTEQAIIQLTRAIDLCDSSALPYRYRGEAYARLNDYDLASADLRRALALGLEPHASKRATQLLATIETAQQKGAVAVATIDATHVPGGASGGPANPSPSAAAGAAPPSGSGAPKPAPDGAVAGTPQPTPPPSPPDAATSAAVANMFAADKDARIEATTSLLVDARRVAAAVPLAVRAATAQADNESGVINTLVLLQSAGPTVLRQQRDAIEALLTRAERNGPQTAELVAKVRAAMNPVVYIQLGGEKQRALADRLRRELQARGFEVPGLEDVSTKNVTVPATPEVRVHGASGRGAAQLIASIVQDLAEATPRILSITRAAPKRDTYEIWLDRRTCVERRVGACGS